MSLNPFLPFTTVDIILMLVVLRGQFPYPPLLPSVIVYLSVVETTTMIGISDFRRLREVSIYLSSTPFAAMSYVQSSFLLYVIFFIKTSKNGKEIIIVSFKSNIL